MKAQSNLKRTRFFKDVSQCELAFEVGCCQSVISKLECGTLRPLPSTEKLKKKVAEFFNSTVEEMFPIEGK